MDTRAGDNSPIGILLGKQDDSPAASTPSAEMLELLHSVDKAREVMQSNADALFALHLTETSGLRLAVEIAHNLRSPLTSILFLSEALLHGHSGDVSDLQRRQLGLIYNATLGLTSMVSDIVELANGSDCLMEKQPSSFSVAEMLESICDMVRPMAEGKGLDLRTHAPPGDRRLGYPTALSRVLLNLTTNALKFTEQGFVEIVTRAKGCERIEFSVRDTGDGLDIEAQDELYQPFRRSSSRGTIYGFSGTGLGLAMCRRLVTAMRSELHYDTAKGLGTRFYFEVDLPPASSS